MHFQNTENDSTTFTLKLIFTYQSHIFSFLHTMKWQNIKFGYNKCETWFLTNRWERFQYIKCQPLCPYVVQQFFGLSTSWGYFTTQLFTGVYRNMNNTVLLNFQVDLSLSLFFSVDIMVHDFLHFLFFQVQYIYYCWKHYVERFRRNFHILFYGSH